jgi:alpha-tubulin suppressor-like RCC1 family protein
MVFALVSRLSTGQLFRSVSCGGHHCCAIRDGAVRSLHCWGSDKYGQLGTGNYQNTSIVPWSSSLTGVVSVSAGAYHSCALTSVPGVPVARTNDDLTAPLSLYCWGYPYSGVVGIASLYETCQIRGDCLAPRPLLVPVANFDGLHVIQLSVGTVAEHVCTLAGVERLLFCWGRNTDGQTGVGTTANIPSPTQVFGFPSSQSVIEVITGSRHTCILMASRSVASSSTLGAILLGSERKRPMRLRFHQQHANSLTQL